MISQSDFADCVDAYSSLREYLALLFSRTKKSPPGSDEEYAEGWVIIGLFYLFFDIASSVTKQAEYVTKDLVSYLNAFVSSPYFKLLLC